MREYSSRALLLEAAHVWLMQDMYVCTQYMLHSTVVSRANPYLRIVIIAQL